MVNHNESPTEIKATSGGSAEVVFYVCTYNFYELTYLIICAYMYPKLSTLAIFMP